MVAQGWASGGGANGTHVTIPAGATSVLVEVDTLADILFESTENFTLEVGAVVSGTVGDTTRRRPRARLSKPRRRPMSQSRMPRPPKAALWSSASTLSNPSDAAVTARPAGHRRKRHRRHRFRDHRLPIFGRRWRDLAERRRRERHRDHLQLGRHQCACRNRQYRRRGLRRRRDIQSGGQMASFPGSSATPATTPSARWWMMKPRRM